MWQPARIHPTVHTFLLFIAVAGIVISSASPAAAQVPVLNPKLHTAFNETSRDVDLRIKGHWQELIKTCHNRTYHSCQGVDKSAWTNAVRTQVFNVSVQGLGRWSTFSLATYAYNGSKKVHGGDSWFMLLKDKVQQLTVPTRVFDEGDGSYTAACVFLQPGNYTLEARLLYSDCHGLQEPTLQNYVNLVQPSDHCYLGATVNLSHIVVNAGDVADCLMADCARGTAHSSGQGLNKSHINDTYGRVVRMEMYYYRQHYQFITIPCCKRRHWLFPLKQPTRRLLLWGDSTVKRAWTLLMNTARKPCNVTWTPHMFDELFEAYRCAPTTVAEADPEMAPVLERCTAGAPWTTVPIGSNTIEVSKYYPGAMTFDMRNFTYNSTFARLQNLSVVPREFTVVYMNGWGCLPLDLVLKDLQFIQAGDVFVLNIGAHCTRTMPFAEWQSYMDGLAAALKDVISKVGATIVWRTSFMIKEHVYRSAKLEQTYLPSAHFSTDARRQLQDSYAEYVLTAAGVHVWDVTGMSAMGEFRPHDMMHADGYATRTMNLDMLDQFVCL